MRTMNAQREMSTDAQVDPRYQAGNSAEVQEDRRIVAVRKVGGFLLRLLQMVVVMEGGMAVYGLLAHTALAKTGYAALTNAYPIIGYLTMEVSMVAPVLPLMRFWHKSPWSYALQMSAVMLAPVAALTALVLSHVIPMKILYGFGDPGMLLAMVVCMLVLRPKDAFQSVIANVEVNGGQGEQSL
jgi:hypothetical protein